MSETERNRWRGAGPPFDLRPGTPEAESAPRPRNPMTRDGPPHSARGSRPWVESVSRHRLFRRGGARRPPHEPAGARRVWPWVSPVVAFLIEFLRASADDDSDQSRGRRGGPDMTRIAIYDTTLRDGSQGEGVNFSLQDKLLITARLDALGVDYVEGGYPLSNPKDAAYFRAVRDLDLTHAQGHRLRHDPPQGGRGRGRRRHEGPGRRRDPGRHDRRQELGLPGPRGPGRLARREPADDRRLGRLLRVARAPR